MASAPGLGEEKVLQSRRALFRQSEAIGEIVDLVDLPVAERDSYAQTLREYVIADPEQRKEIKVTWMEMFNLGTSIQIEPISSEEWLKEDPTAAKELEKKKSDFRDNLKAHMDALGLNQSGIAERLGVTQSWISQLASGRYKPQPESLRKLAHALRCTVDDLWPP